MEFEGTADISGFNLLTEKWKFNLGDTTGAEEPPYNDAEWRVLDLPHDWSIEGEFNRDEPAGHDSGYLPTGIGWYRKPIPPIQDIADKKVFIQFDGIFHNSTVWLNGNLLGERANGYIGFQ